MKSAAVFLTVIFLIAATLLIGGSFATSREIITASYDNTALKERKAASLPLPDNKQIASPAAAILKTDSPRVHIIEKKGDSKGHIPSPAKAEEEEDSDRLIGCVLEIEAQYPGGPAAWQRYLNRNMRFPEEALEEEMSFNVIVQFVVDEEGNVRDVEAVSGSKALGAEAVRVIEKSGKWTPAVRQGRSIRSLKKQPFIICVEAEE